METEVIEVVLCLLHGGLVALKMGVEDWDFFCSGLAAGKGVVMVRQHFQGREAIVPVDLGEVVAAFPLEPEVPMELATDETWRVWDVIDTDESGAEEPVRGTSGTVPSPGPGND